MTRAGDVASLHGVACNLLVRLVQLMRSCRTYPDGHPALDRAISLVTEQFDALSPQAASTQIMFVAGGDVLVDGERVRPSQGQRDPIGELASFLADRGVGGFVVVGPGASGQAVSMIRALLELPGDGTPGAEAVNALLVQAGVTSLQMCGIRVEVDPVSFGGETDPVLLSLWLYLRGIRAVDRMMSQGLGPSALKELEYVSAGLVDLVKTTPTRAMMYTRPHQGAPYNLRHPVHMAILSIGMGVRLGLRDGELNEVGLCALCVDVGMASLPAHLKGGGATLTPKDQRLVQHHPGVSVRVMLKAPRLGLAHRRRIVVAFEHHLGLDSAGYPEVAYWPELHPFSRIVSVADAFDALRADDEGHPGLATAAALRVLAQESGSRFDAFVVAQLDAMVRTAEGIPVTETGMFIRRRRG